MRSMLAVIAFASFLGSGCEALRNAMRDSGEHSEAIDERASHVRLDQIFDGPPLFFVSEVTMSDDIETTFIAQACGKGKDITDAQVKTVLAQIRKEAAEHLYGLAAESGAAVPRDKSVKAPHDALCVACKITALSVECKSGQSGGSAVIDATSGTTEATSLDAEFCCEVTLTASKGDFDIAMKRANVSYAHTLQRSSVNALTASADRKVDQKSSSQADFVLNAPSKVAVKRAVSDAWLGLWEGYRERLKARGEQSHGADATAESTTKS